MMEKLRHNILSLPHSLPHSLFLRHGVAYNADNQRIF
jgi:hypothetical protein